MLLFIHGAGREGAPEGTFQYITCYSLSNPGMQGPVGRLWFQYITCYSLSMDAYVVMQDHIKFQYITCYSLSRSGEKTRDLADVSIHHMLLFIISDVDLYIVKNMFQYITCYSLSERLSGPEQIFCVSIHHMLLFIDSTDTQKFAFLLFQYITCYSLSNTTQGSNITGLCFNTSHVTLYPRTFTGEYRNG